jgi:hypothetical protein
MTLKRSGGSIEPSLSSPSKRARVDGVVDVVGCIDPPYLPREIWLLISGLLPLGALFALQKVSRYFASDVPDVITELLLSPGMVNALRYNRSYAVHKDRVYEVSGSVGSGYAPGRLAMHIQFDLQPMWPFADKMEPELLHVRHIFPPCVRRCYKCRCGASTCEQVFVSDTARYCSAHCKNNHMSTCATRAVPNKR